MIEIPNECSNTWKHLRIHLLSLIESAEPQQEDLDQALHEVNMIRSITLNMIEKRDRLPKVMRPKPKSWSDERWAKFLAFCKDFDCDPWDAALDEEDRLIFYYNASEHPMQ